MTISLTLATAIRVLRQIRHDPRTLAMLLVVPSALIGLLAWIYQGGGLFDRIGAPLLALFPVIVMFLITSVSTLRERQSGTMERLLTLPLAKADLIGGYAVAFGGLGIAAALIATAFSVQVLGLDVAGPLWLLVVVSTVDSLLGTALGLFISAFARSEFQAVQFLPAVIVPQFLLCGLLVPRDDLPGGLSQVSDILPLSYAIDAMTTITTSAQATGSVLKDVLIVAGFVLGLVILGAATLRRRTP
ncbi:ABC transporter permease [Kineosporia sp. NBRC 101731]|uniref:ABC transporter permease n=1 Tax=Kineosporia sp. NBRC 101731 TaxID=3032199 RepID=UPI0024A3E7E6|nr:ABC transporter permease [Kineosporia sp. NBRC 101731]GLY29451.1 transport permease protein [Kineosporia sp. NBRC 101731]